MRRDPGHDEIQERRVEAKSPQEETAGVVQPWAPPVRDVTLAGGFVVGVQLGDRPTPHPISTREQMVGLNRVDHAPN